MRRLLLVCWCVLVLPWNAWGQTGTRLAQSGLSVVSVDSQETDVGPHLGTNVLDGNGSTYWLTRYALVTDPLPHTLVLNLGNSYQVDGVAYLPSTSNHPYGTITTYEVYVSTDGATWGAPVASGTWPADPTEKVVRFPAKRGHYLALVALTDAASINQTCVAELNVYASSAARQGRPLVLAWDEDAMPTGVTLTGFIIQACLAPSCVAGCTPITVGTTDPGVLIYTDPSVTGGLVYVYQVLAVGTYGGTVVESSPSAQICGPALYLGPRTPFGGKILQ